MNKNLLFIIGSLLLIPAWVFKGGLKSHEIFIVLFLIYLIPSLIHLYIVKKYKKNLYTKLFYFYFALIFTYSLDQNYGIMSYVDRIPNFLNIKPYALYVYASAFFVLTSGILIIFFYLRIFKYNGIKILFSFAFIALLVNLFDNRNSSFFEKKRNINSFYEGNLQPKKKLVLILDEFSGINSYESNHISGIKVKKKIENFLTNSNFTYYTNAYSLSSSTSTSIPLMLNFKYENSKIQFYRKYYTDVTQRNFIEINKDFFLTDNNLNKNEFFDSYNGNNIAVFQNMSINYCAHYKVKTCVQYNPFKTDYNYLPGVKNKNLSRIISLWKLQSSILSNFVWRILRIEIIDNTLPPYGEKMTASHLFEDIFKQIKNGKEGLVFVHTLFSHKPYGFDENCYYDGSRSMDTNQKKSLVEWKTSQNNIERSCVIDVLNNFFDKLKKNNLWNDLEIILLSDHGSRISKENFATSYLSSLFAVKQGDRRSEVIHNKLSIQYLFFKHFKQ
jgi:hypothetical protein